MITYTTVQAPWSLRGFSRLTLLFKLHFSLCDATHWVCHFNGFNYKEFYEFVVDFFEADQTLQGKVALRELCNWWNRYVSSLYFDCRSLTPPQKSVPKVCCYSGSLGATVVACSPTRAALSPLALLSLLVPFRVAFVVTLIYSTQYHCSLNLTI